MNALKRFQTKTVEVECIISDPLKPSYRIRGVAQRLGDRSRLPLFDAADLVQRGKARIVPNSEKVELL